MQHLWWLKNNIFDRLEILVQKAEYGWHGNDEACKLDICGLILGPPLRALGNSIEYKDK